MLSRRAAARIILPMWALPPPQILLEPGSLHIWRASLSLPAGQHERLEALLSGEEKAQCGRLVRAEDRSRCAASRGLLRVVLAKYLREDPRMLSLTPGTSGKPSLDHANHPVQFNVSHAEDLALVAVTRDCRVGIDIERIRAVPDMEAILDDFFSREETACVRSRRGKGRLQAFFHLWTRREAAAKALGIGLFDCFKRVALPTPRRTRSWFRIGLPGSDGPAGQTVDWWMRDLALADGYSGAVCTEQARAKPLFLTLTTSDLPG